MEGNAHPPHWDLSEFLACIKCIVHPTCVKKLLLVYHILLTSSFCMLCVPVCNLNLCPPLPSSTYVHSPLAYLRSLLQQFFPPPFLHHWLPLFSMKTVSSACKNISILTIFSTFKKHLVILTSPPVTNLFPCSLCYKILKSAISTHCLSFPFYHSLLKSPHSILWPHQSTETALIRFAKDLHIARSLLI